MAYESTRAALDSLECAHRDDGDGGYRLASALCEYRIGMPASSAEEWDSVLMEWAKDETSGRWGVALEALAREGSRDVTKTLSVLLVSHEGSSEWREYVIHTLIRQGYATPALVSEVRSAALQKSALGLPNLARLIVLVPQQLKTAAQCFVEAIHSGEVDYAESNVPPFVYAALDSGPDLLVDLVQAVSLIERRAGVRLGNMIIEYLGKPFVQSRFERGTLLELLEKLRPFT